MKTILKWFGLALLVFVVLPVTGLVVVNLFDEDVDPKAAAYGAPSVAIVPVAENAYYAMIAINAPDSADGMAYARAWQNEVRNAANENRKEKLPESRRAKRPELCDSRHTACIALIRSGTTEVVRQLEAYKEDLVRYDAVLDRERFEEVVDFPMRAESSLPSYSGLLGAQRAYLLRAGLDFEANKFEEAVVALEREFAFQRLLLGSSRTLLGKMVSVVAYWRALQFVNELADTYPAQLVPYMPRIYALLKPLDPSALNLARAFEMEFGNIRGSYQNYELLEKQYPNIPLGRVGYGLFFKHNASLNFGYRLYSGLAPALGASADRIESELNAYAAKWNPAWDYLYNPVGKIITIKDVQSLKTYYARLHDLDALNRLLALRLEMLTSGVTVERASEFIAKADVRFHNPYTRKPMNWDAERKHIYFEAQSDSIRQLKHGVIGGRVFVAL